MRSESKLYGPTHATKTTARIALCLVAMWIVALIGMAALGGSTARGDEPAAKAVEKAFDKAKASKAVDDAFAKVKTPAVKSAAKAVEEAFKAAKAKGKPDAKSAATPERLPMPREVQVGTAKGAWYIDCPAGPCTECGTACKCVACVCESVTTSHPPLQPWTGGAIPQGWEWVGVPGNGAWRKAGVGSVQLSSNPLQFASYPCANGQCGAVGSPVTFAASPCASGNCPNVQPTTRRR